MVGGLEKVVFRWRKPGEAESSTYVVSGDGSGLRKLSEAEAETSAAGRRALGQGEETPAFQRRGDIAIYDARRSETADHEDERRRRQSALGAQRHARDVCERRHLFIMPVDGSGRSSPS